MFVRIVTHAVRPTETEKMAETYRHAVIAALRTTDGCRFASLLQSTEDPSRCLSMTIWDSRTDSDTYEKSGLFSQLVHSLRPHFAESDEWKLELTDDLSLEYVPIPSDPVVERFDQPMAGPEIISSLKAVPFAVQMLEFFVQADKTDDFMKIFTKEISPAYAKQKGFIDMILLLQGREFHIISFWDETADIQPDSGYKSVSELMRFVDSLLPSFIRRKTNIRNAAPTIVSSEDITSSIYRSLIAEWFET